MEIKSSLFALFCLLTCSYSFTMARATRSTPQEGFVSAVVCIDANTPQY